MKTNVSLVLIWLGPNQSSKVIHTNFIIILSWYQAHYCLTLNSEPPCSLSYSLSLGPFYITSLILLEILSMLQIFWEFTYSGDESYFTNYHENLTLFLFKLARDPQYIIVVNCFSILQHLICCKLFCSVIKKEECVR